MNFLLQETGLNIKSCSLSHMKRELAKLKAKPDNCDNWRIQYLGKLLSLRGESHYRGDEFVVNEFSKLIDSICIN